ncbi:MAG: universal stress protein [Synechococcales cyanobacterium C42_A2020_086]|jgi:nucleotide-binding universal stress UspA family protein|nr:universal stress protein [Synechococcales cyanobacterium C42_A2020_086]
MFHKILVAIDQSEVSQRAFETAIAMAKALHSHLMLINVLSPFEADYPSPVFSMDAIRPTLNTDVVQGHLRQWQLVEQQGLEFLKVKTDQATAAGIPTEFTQALGDPGHAICTLARTWEANLIIIGRRGYKGLGELFIGSVSNYVTHHAPCSVLTVQGAVDLEPPQPIAEAPDETPGYDVRDDE